MRLQAAKNGATMVSGHVDALDRADNGFVASGTFGAITARAVVLATGVIAEGCITVDSHQRTNIPGMYAAGDVVLGLDQISHAMSEGGVAATTLRNDLAERRSLHRAQRPDAYTKTL